MYITSLVHAKLSEALMAELKATPYGQQVTTAWDAGGPEESFGLPPVAIMAAWHKACLLDEKLSREQFDDLIKNWLQVWLAGKRNGGKKSKAPIQALSPPPAAMSKVARDTQDLQEKNAFKRAQIQEAELNQQAQKCGVGAAGPSNVPSTPGAEFSVKRRVKVRSPAHHYIKDI